MSAIVVGDDSGYPKRCFVWTDPKTRIEHKFCIVWLEYPSFIWRRTQPDPGPIDRLQIEGVDPLILRDLELIDIITWLSWKLSPQRAHAVEGVIRSCLEGIQGALPTHLSLSP